MNEPVKPEPDERPVPPATLPPDPDLWPGEPDLDVTIPSLGVPAGTQTRINLRRRSRRIE